MGMESCNSGAGGCGSARMVRGVAGRCLRSVHAPVLYIPTWLDSAQLGAGFCIHLIFLVQEILHKQM